MNTKLTIVIELSDETYRHISNIVNLAQLLKVAAEKELYKFVLEDL